MQSTADSSAGGLMPGRPTAGGGGAWPVAFIAPEPRSNPSEHKLLTPSPPHKELISSFRG